MDTSKSNNMGFEKSNWKLKKHTGKNLHPDTYKFIFKKIEIYTVNAVHPYLEPIQFYSVKLRMYMYWEFYFIFWQFSVYIYKYTKIHPSQKASFRRKT
jgi:hypothetical protein